MIKTGVSYFGNRMLKHAEEDMLDIKNHNCDFVVHTFSENDLEYYTGTMKDIIAATKELGLEVWLSPWRVAAIFGGEAYTSWTLRHVRRRQVSSSGKDVRAACPNKKATKKFLKTWIRAAAEIETDYILWDEPHFFGSPKLWQKWWCCRCNTCKRLYQRRYGREMPLTFTKSIKEFRGISIANFLKELSKYAKKQGLKVAVVLTPWEMDNAERLARIKDIDVIACDPYWGFKGKTCDINLDVEKFVEPHIKKLVELGKKYNKEVQAWIQAFDIKKGTENDLNIAAKTFVKLGVKSIAAWGFHGCSQMSYLKSEDPDKVWDVLGQTYKELKS